MKKPRHLVGQNLKKIREKRRINQDDLALASGVAKVTISRIENGHQMAEESSVEALAKALGVFPDELYQKNGNDKTKFTTVPLPTDKDIESLTQKVRDELDKVMSKVHDLNELFIRIPHNHGESIDIGLIKDRLLVLYKAVDTGKIPKDEAEQLFFLIEEFLKKKGRNISRI